MGRHDTLHSESLHSALSLYKFSNNLLTYFKSYASVSKTPIHNQLIVKVTFVPDMMTCIIMKMSYNGLLNSCDLYYGEEKFTAYTVMCKWLLW